MTHAWSVSKTSWTPLWFAANFYHVVMESAQNISVDSSRAQCMTMKTMMNPTSVFAAQNAVALSMDMT